MSAPQLGYVWPISLIPGYPSLIRLLNQVPETVAGDVWVFDIQRLDFLGGL
jgi:hypothetical protein